MSTVDDTLTKMLLARDAETGVTLTARENNVILDDISRMADIESIFDISYDHAEHWKAEYESLKRDYKMFRRSCEIAVILVLFLVWLVTVMRVGQP